MSSGLGSVFKTATPPILKLTAKTEIERTNKCRMLQLKTNFEFEMTIEIIEHFTFTKILRTRNELKKSYNFKLQQTEPTLLLPQKKLKKWTTTLKFETQNKSYHHF